MVGSRLAMTRKRAKMRQEELAQILGVTKHSISMYENDKSSPSDNSYFLIAKTFDISVDYLLGLVDEPYSYKRDSVRVIRVPEAMSADEQALLREFVEFLWGRHSE